MVTQFEPKYTTRGSCCINCLARLALHVDKFDIFHLPSFQSRMIAKPGQSIGQNVGFSRDVCYFVEGYALDVAQDSEMLRISYLSEVFLIHLDQPLAVRV